MKYNGNSLPIMLQNVMCIFKSKVKTEWKCFQKLLPDWFTARICYGFSAWWLCL